MQRALLLLTFLSPLLAPAQTPAGKQAMLTVKHTVDFDLAADDSATVWHATSWTPLINRKGSSDYAAKVKTLYSDNGIYFIFSCEDRKINATMTEDFANLFKEDVVEIFLWPDESMPLYLEYELSPLNYELAILVPHLNGRIYGWQPWHYEGQRKTRHATKIIKGTNDEVSSWTAEVFIPFALLQPLQKVPPQKGTHWRANLYRIDYDNDTSYWSWQPFEKNFHDFEMYGTLAFE